MKSYEKYAPLLLVLLITWIQGSVVLGQERDVVLTVSDPVASFSRARSLSVTQDGRIYVVDADRNAVVVLGPEGDVLEIVGGPGTDEGQFDEPADIDPTTGLIINIADAGNGRIQRFARGFRFLESLPVTSEYADQNQAANPSFRMGSARIEHPPYGFPISVTSSPADDLYVIDQFSGVVMRWDRDRRNRWTIGDQESGDGELLNPVDIAANARYLFVADMDHAAILSFDLFGTYVRTIARGQLRSIVGVKTRDDRLMAVMPDRIVEFSEVGRLVRTVRFEIDEKLVAADYLRNRFYLLSEEHLYIVESQNK